MLLPLLSRNVFAVPENDVTSWRKECSLASRDTSVLPVFTVLRSVSAICGATSAYVPLTLASSRRSSTSAGTSGLSFFR